VLLTEVVPIQVTHILFLSFLVFPLFCPPPVHDDGLSPEHKENENIKIANRSFEIMAKFRYLEMTVTGQNFINEEIKSRLKSCNAHYHVVQNVVL
jgi:hypothetical protein